MIINRKVSPTVSSVVVKHTLSMREVWGSIPGPDKSAQCRQRLATAATFLWSCVVQALNRVDGPRHSLHVLMEYREYNEELIFFMFLSFCIDRIHNIYIDIFLTSTSELGTASS